MSCCDKAEPCYHNIFQSMDLDRLAACMFCKKRAPVRFWKCQCDIGWHTCILHKNANIQHRLMINPGYPDNSTHRRRPANRGAKRKKHFCYLHSQTDLDDEEQPAASKKARIGPHMFCCSMCQYGSSSSLQESLATPRFTAGSRSILRSAIQP